ncbi:MAG TPA: aminotransferase class IV [Bacteroidales bacterium]|jgi:D-alanine transaminase|nr:aminotransferase class IV [Bacteroidales bacterium]
MEMAYFNGNYIPKDEVRISPDDRGFLFAEGIYEVVRWYRGFFYDMDSHVSRMKRSLREIKITWPEEDTFPVIARELIRMNNLRNSSALVYLEVTRGSASRTHAFPNPSVSPTVYAYAKEFVPENNGKESGVSVMLSEDIRWSRCDIKSVALLANTLLFQEALDKGFFEVAFTRNGLITECSHSNIFFAVNGILFTHPESVYILSGVTRKNIIRIARKTGIPVKEEAIDEKMIGAVREAFITNTSGEVTPVVKINDVIIGEGAPGPLTRTIRERFNDHICSLKH